MVAQLLPLISGFSSSSSSSSDLSLSFSGITTTTATTTRTRRRRRALSLTSSSASSSSGPVINGGCQGQTHYGVLGLAPSASGADIKRAYRLLARKYHPDVSKHSQAGEVFKSIRQAYDILSNEATRIQYDQELTIQRETGGQYSGKWYSTDLDDGIRIYNWGELRQKIRCETQWKHYTVNEENPPYGQQEEAYEDGSSKARGSFSEVLRSAFVSLILLQIFGPLLSLTFSSLMALFDPKLDAGYKMGYIIAWVLGGRGGILLTLCLSFASWICGKTGSSMVILVVVAMWVGSNVARFAPLPQGALLTLLYMSIKLQGDLN